jgi:hypothetical protein
LNALSPQFQRKKLGIKATYPGFIELELDQSIRGRARVWNSALAGRKN